MLEADIKWFSGGLIFKNRSHLAQRHMLPVEAAAAMGNVAGEIK